jgi:thiosulfate/3-mercaptopyruvate sulfurtransferase
MTHPPRTRPGRPMSISIRVLLLASLALGGCAPANDEPAAPEAAPLLVSSEWVAGVLGEEGIVLLHVGSDSSHAAGHIPGARPLPLSGFAPEVDGMSTEMPDPSRLRDLLEGAGVSADSRIVIYSASHPPQFAARLYLTLEHFGLGHRASILDGGLRGWEREGRPLSTDPPGVERGTLPELTPGGDLLVGFDQVARRMSGGGATIVDARDAPFWTGEQHLQARAARPGRIPGARNVPFRSLVTESGHFLDPAALRALFREAGIQEGEPVVAYCHVGQQASLLTVAARLLGHPVELYDGSWEDWSQRMELAAEVDEE